MVVIELSDKEYPITVSVLFKGEGDSAVRAFMEAFEEMVSWWLERMAASSKRSYRALRAQYYNEARARWGEWNSQHVETSGALAFFIHSRRAGQKAMRFAVLSPQVVAVAGERLRISIKPRLFGYVKLRIESAQQKLLLELADERLCKLGQVVLFENGAIIPFLLGLNLSRGESAILKKLLES